VGGVGLRSADEGDDVYEAGGNENLLLSLGESRPRLRAGGTWRRWCEGEESGPEWEGWELDCLGRCCCGRTSPVELRRPLNCHAHPCTPCIDRMKSSDSLPNL